MRHRWLIGEADTLCGKTIHWGRARLVPEPTEGGQDEGTAVQPQRHRSCASCDRRAGGLRQDALVHVVCVNLGGADTTPLPREAVLLDQLKARCDGASFVDVTPMLIAALADVAAAAEQSIATAEAFGHSIPDRRVVAALARLRLVLAGEDDSSADAPCSRCSATPKTGLRDGCPECEGIVPPIGVPRDKRRLTGEEEA